MGDGNNVNGHPVDALIAANCSQYLLFWDKIRGFKTDIYFTELKLRPQRFFTLIVPLFFNFWELGAGNCNEFYKGGGADLRPSLIASAKLDILMECRARGPFQALQCNVIKGGNE